MKHIGILCSITICLCLCWGQANAQCDTSDRVVIDIAPLEFEIK